MLSPENIAFYSLIAYLLFNSYTVVDNSLNVLDDEARDAQIRDVAYFIAENTDDDDLISVMGNDNILYLRSQRQSATKYSYQVPIMYVDHNIEREYFKEIAEKKPKAIIITDRVLGTEACQTMVDFCIYNDYQELCITGVTVYLKMNQS